MSNLTSFDNIYVSLAESAYTNRPNNFPPEANSKNWVKFDFSKDAFDNMGNLTNGGKSLPNEGKVYLQPDSGPQTSTVTVKVSPDGLNPAQHVQDSHQEIVQNHTLMQNPMTGFNAYLVTDHPDLKNTNQAYFVVRGSDAISPSHLNDWVINDGYFAFTAQKIPQANDAQKALHTQIQNLVKANPNAQMNVTAHSLGTIVSIQAVASLSADDLKHIGKVVLFDGPDATASIKNMGSKAMTNIKQLEAENKIDYYVNPFDLISMLNRSGDNQIGNVHLLVPTVGTSTFSGDSSHDFGVMQINDGKMVVANPTDDPELFATQQELSSLVDKYRDALKRISIGDLAHAVLTGDFAGLLGSVLGGEAGKVIEFAVSYKLLVDKYSSQLSKPERIPEYKAMLEGLKGSPNSPVTIEVRKELVDAVATQASNGAAAYETDLNTLLNSTKSQIEAIVDRVRKEAFSLGPDLSRSEIEEMLSGFDLAAFWDEGQATAARKEMSGYKSSLEEFGTKIRSASQDFKDFDEKVPRGYFEYYYNEDVQKSINRLQKIGK